MNNYYKLYIEDIYSLAETIVIKFEDAATAINLKVTVDHGVTSVSQDTFTWKYYQNISGVYHFSDLDSNGRKIIIRSLDTKEEIEFTKNNLINHPATKRAYLFGKRHYLELVQKYPQHIQLILGILYPCDINKAIEAKDGTILSYPDYLIESNEYSLISKLQTWIYKYIDRWINKQFTISDDLYVPMYMAQLYLHLVPVIINTRLQACKTNEAHSFHVREYLASHQMLDQHMPVMTKSQSLYFYRNILYIERHSGKRDTFDWLLDNVMTVRGLPVYEYAMKHDVSNMLATNLNNQTTSYYPDVFFRKNSLNYKVYDAPNAYIPLEDVNYKLKYTYPGNEEYLFQNKTKILNTLQDSISNVVGTKLLESSVTDYTDMVPYTLESILINHWLYWGATGSYNAYVTVITNIAKDTIELRVIDAFVLMIYALNKSIGYTLETVPELLATRILQQNKVPISVLRNMVDSKYVSDEEITTIYNSAPDTFIVNTVDSFYEQCNKLYQSTIVQDKIQSRAEHYLTRGYLQAAISSMYADIRIDVDRKDLLYKDWLISIGLDFTSYTDVNFADLAISITNDATGILNKAPVSIKTVQKAMIEIFQMLSSYSIQFIDNVNEPPVQLVTNPAIRIGDIIESDRDERYIDISQPDVTAVTTKEHEKEYLDQNTVFPLGEVFSKEISPIIDIPIDIDIELKNNVHEIDSSKIHLANITVYDITDDILESTAFVNGYMELPIRLFSNPETKIFKTYKGKLLNLPVILRVSNSELVLVNGRTFNVPVLLRGSNKPLVAISGTEVIMPIELSGNTLLYPYGEFIFKPATITPKDNNVYFASANYGNSISTLKPPVLVTDNNNVYFATSNYDLINHNFTRNSDINIPVNLSGNFNKHFTLDGLEIFVTISMSGNFNSYITFNGASIDTPISLNGNNDIALEPPSIP